MNGEGMLSNQKDFQGWNNSCGKICERKSARDNSFSILVLKTKVVSVEKKLYEKEICVSKCICMSTKVAKNKRLNFDLPVSYFKTLGYAYCSLHWTVSFFATLFVHFL